MSLSLILALLLAPAPAQRDLLDGVRHTLIKAPFRETALQGDATFFGCESKFSLTFEPDGRFLRKIVGPMPSTVGFDGKTLWQQDSTGAPRILDFEDGEEERFIELLITDRWLDPHAEDKVKVDPEKPNVLDVEMPGGLVSQVTIDPATDEPLVASYETTDGHNRVEFGNWSSVGGNLLPYRVSMGNAEVRDELRVTSSNSSRADFTFPQWTPTDTTFDLTKSPIIECQRPSIGLVVVHPTVNGKDVGWFILDSGADGMAIDPHIANDLNLPKVGMQSVTGVGGTIVGSFRTGGTISLGPITVKNMIFTELDLAGLPGFSNSKIAGIIGADIFRRSIVTLNPNKPEVGIYRPEDYKLPEGTTWSPIKFDGGNPVVEATLNGSQKAWYRLDTGDDGSVTFHKPYVEKEHLLDHGTTGSAQNGGVGGSTDAKTGKVRSFQLGPHRFVNPDVVFSLAEKGAFANHYLAGNIGQTFMRPFTVAFDFGGSRVGFIAKE